MGTKFTIGISHLFLYSQDLRESVNVLPVHSISELVVVFVLLHLLMVLITTNALGTDDHVSEHARYQHCLRGSEWNVRSERNV